ncbi:hypothetical protein GpartN1_g7637.t1 [Galdieria partita]|uniref:Protein kinase domain-containing protein n=1 Tax=Galdieria partita TaxID=83374 RepID=A0A9C7Q449_9RHOD|nr:hypothetical protein GpartN1_g7637.t1 [Galdieria partita]
MSGSSSRFVTNRRVGNKYVLGERIGKGRYGAVFEGFDLETGRVVAIKQLPTKGIPIDEVNSLKSEIKLLRNLQHKNIVEYIGFYEEEEGDHVNIIMEYVEGGSLAKTVNKFSSFPESLVAFYVEQILEGLVYLHEQGVVHRDIKGANLLNTKEGLIKLADFGVAARLDEISSKNNPIEVVGTPYWMAPEIIELSGCSTASDIWSVGCTVVELLTGSPPYSEYTAMSALFHIVSDEHPPLPTGISSELEDFLLRCFNKDVASRVSAKELLSHRWISKSKQVSYDNSTYSLKRETISSLQSKLVSLQNQDKVKETSNVEVAKLEQFEEPKEEETFDDLFANDQLSNTASQRENISSCRMDVTQHLWQRLQQSLDASVAVEGGTELDVVDELDDFAWLSLRSNQGEQQVMAKERALKLLSGMFDDQNLMETRKQCLSELLSLLTTYPSLSQFFTSEGTFSLLLEILDYPRCEQHKLEFVLQLMLHVLCSFDGQESIRSEDIRDLGQFLSSMGFFPIAIKLIDSRISEKVRYLTFHMISVILSEREENILMFFACRGAPRILSTFFEEVKIEVNKYILGTLKALYFLTDKWCQSFGREWCRSMAKYGFIERFVGFLYRVTTFEEIREKEYSLKDEMMLISLRTLEKFGLFVQGEQSDVTIRTHFQSIQVLSPMCQLLSQLKGHCFVSFLSIFEVLCRNAETHDTLQECGAIQILVYLLSTLCDASGSDPCRRHILLSLYYLCLSSPKRKEEAAIHGIIPVLQSIIRHSGVLFSSNGRKFISIETTKSVEMLCWFATVRSRKVMHLLLKSNGVEFFLDLLSVVPGKDKAKAGSSLVELLEREPNQVESILIQEKNIQRIVHLVTTLGQNEIEYMLDSYVRLLVLSVKIRESLYKHQAVEKFFSRLKHPKTSVRKLLLQILQLLLQDYPRVFSKAEKQVLLDLERNDSAVMIRELAGSLIRRMAKESMTKS